MKITNSATIFFIVVTGLNCVKAQSKFDSLIYATDSMKVDRVMCYPQKDQIVIYRKPKVFGFITQLPKTFYSTAKMTFRKESIPVISGIAVSTAVLIGFDQNITNGVQKFSRYIHLNSSTNYTSLITFKLGSSKIPVYELPRNFNTAVYSIGEGFTSMMVCGAMFTYGKIKKDYRSLQTASQLLQAQLAIGFLAQTVKRISGRESPSVATAPGGVWRPFPSFSSFQHHTSKYDAFPSGHLTTMMTTVTVLALNYPEKKLIKPIGYSLIGLVGLAMINNSVHWASDYPLALGIGYVTANATVKMNRWIKNKK